MKILFTMINGKPSKNKGGGEKIIYLLAKSLTNKKLNCHFLSTEFSFQFSEDFFKTNKLIFTKPKSFINKVLNYQIFLRLYYIYPVFTTLFFIKKIKYLLKSNLVKEFDIIHAHEPLSLYLIPKHKEKRILTIHTKGSFINELKHKYSFISLKVLNYLRRIEIQGIKTADVITFPSNYAKKLYFYQYKFVSMNNIEIINNGIEEIKSKNTYELKNLTIKIKNKFDFLILNVANHIYEKKIDILIQTVKKLKDNGQNPFLINVGEGIKTKELKILSKELNLVDNILFLGKIENSEVNYLMQECDFFILTSEKAIFDLTILEALQKNCRIICNKDGGNSEIIVNGFNGYLAENNLPSEYMNLILNFDDNILKNVSRSSQKYTLDKMSNQFMALYERATKSK